MTLSATDKEFNVGIQRGRDQAFREVLEDIEEKKHKIHSSLCKTICHCPEIVGVVALTNKIKARMEKA